MLRRLEYVFFIAGIILLAVMAPVVLFAVRDRISNQTLYTDNQELTASGILTNSYIEDDEERYTTFLYNQSHGVEYAVMELDSTLSEEELSKLLTKTGLCEDYDFWFIKSGVVSVSDKQYAVYNTEDHRDIIFLLTLVTVQMYNVSGVVDHDSYDAVRILVDSQTGMLYYMGVYYTSDYYEDYYEEYHGLFSDDPNEAAAAYQDIFLYMDIQDLFLSCADLIEICLSPFLYDVIEDVSLVEERKVSTFTALDSLEDLMRSQGFLTGVEFTVYQKTTTFPLSFAVHTSDASSYVTVTFAAQFNTYAYHQDSDFEQYQCNLCIGLEDMVFLLPEFNYWSPSVG